MRIHVDLDLQHWHFPCKTVTFCEFKVWPGFGSGSALIWLPVSGSALRKQAGSGSGSTLKSMRIHNTAKNLPMKVQKPFWKAGNQVYLLTLVNLHAPESGSASGSESNTSKYMRNPSKPNQHCGFMRNLHSWSMPIPHCGSVQIRVQNTARHRHEGLNDQSQQKGKVIW